MHVPSPLSNFIAYVKNQFGLYPKAIRTNNGTEFVNSSCVSILTFYGIIHQKHMPYNPQPNGIVERKHRYLLDTARSIQFHANLPQILGGMYLDCHFSYKQTIYFSSSKEISF